MWPNKKIIFIHLLIYLMVLPGYSKAAGSVNVQPSPSAAIFIINNSGSEYDQYLPVIKDNLTSLLTQKGLSIVRSENALLPSGMPDTNDSKVSDPQQEAALNRLAESLNAGLLVVSTINSVVHEENEFDGSGTIYKSSNKTAIDTVRVNLQVYDVGSTKSIYGDSVSTAVRTPIYGQQQSHPVLVKLFNEAAVRIADNITTHVSQIKLSASAPVKKASFTISTNIPSVDVFIDGMVIGSTGEKTKFEVSPGIHQLKLGKELLKSWEKTVNIVDGANYSAQLELSSDGLKRYKDIEAFNFAMKAANTSLETSKKEAQANIDIAKQQSKAEAEAKVEIAKGEREKRENSYIRDDGFVDNLKKIQGE